MLTSDRQSFFRAIAQRPTDDLPRLIMADWLEETSFLDRDVATVEYIRRTCGRTTKKGTAFRIPTPPGTGAWIEENWRRLLPALTAQWDHPMVQESGNTFAGLANWLAVGRCRVFVPFVMNTRYRGRQLYVPGINLHFSRGFLVSASWWAPSLGKKIAELIALDQPLATHRGPDAKVCRFQMQELSV